MYKPTAYCSFLEIQAFNFQLPTTTTNVTQAARRRRALSENYVKAIPQHKLNTTHGFSFLIRTRQVDGLVGFLLDKEPASSTDTGMSYVLIELQNRYLKVTFKEEKASRTQTLVDESSKLLIADGKWLEVGITSSFVRVGDQAVNLTTPISLMINLVLMGGVDKPALYSSITNTAELLGCLQAAKIGGEFLTNQVISGAKTVSVDKAPNVGTGCPGGPVCQPDPCLFNGQCTDQWYDFSCTCQLGFSGKTCSEFGCGLNNTCQPVDSCVDVPLSSPPATSCKFHFCMCVCCNENDSFSVSFDKITQLFEVTKLSKATSFSVPFPKSIKITHDLMIQNECTFENAYSMPQCQCHTNLLGVTSNIMSLKLASYLTFLKQLAKNSSKNKQENISFVTFFEFVSNHQKTSKQVNN